jgi:hypothetical protein
MLATSESVGQLFLLYARTRDEKLFRHLVTKAYPEMLWGDYRKQLSNEDRAWIDSLNLH